MGSETSGSRARAAAGGRPAVLLDALGTLLRFEPPAPRLRAALAARGVDVGEAAATAAMRAEIGFYRRHLHEGRDPASLAALRERSAEAMRPALGPAAAALPRAALTAALLDALVFVAYPDAAPALAALREDGYALVVVSNWDASLPERLAETGLAPLVDAAVASAVLGVAKPERAIFAHALGLVDARPKASWHVGDTWHVDVAGARAAGLRPVLVTRAGERALPGGGDAGGAARGPAPVPAERRRGAAWARKVPVLADLRGLPGLVAASAA
jgi:putative hydrolase of the HAD superfamily